MRTSHFIALTSVLALTPLLASAHETQMFRIGEKTYSFVIGSLNEPVAVDDKSGVSVAVSLVSPEEVMEPEHDEGTEHGHEAPVPVTGLEQTLKVEVSAAGKTKVMDLTSVFGEPGSYKAVYIPTVQTTLTYRLFGTVEGKEVNLSFSCNPAGHPQSEDDKSEVEVSPGVTRTLKRGAFGCPVGRADLGFPEPSATVQELKSGSNTISLIGAVLGLLGLIAGGMALAKSHKH
ncbi:MAG: hypothetical protein Q7R81_00330 [Candidatus Peregrinibacteria bacterium]|nr:hypothetical protein [Candidatus Peregrinibacteria bacterium]